MAGRVQVQVRKLKDGHYVVGEAPDGEQFFRGPLSEQQAKVLAEEIVGELKGDGVVVHQGVAPLEPKPIDTVIGAVVLVVLLGGVMAIAWFLWSWM